MTVSGSMTILPWELGCDEAEREICQNVAIILSTRKGTVPHHRNFGITYEFLDSPVSQIRPQIYGEIYDAITRFEPRVRVDNVKFTVSNDGKVEPVVDITILKEDL